jgi:fido (protein-threonine AMPylation protein)
MDNLAALLQERSQIKDRLSKLLYGSTEIRESDGKKYLYVHYRDGGVLMSKYAGGYSQELANLIIANSALARDYKKRLRNIQKALDEAGYVEGSIGPKVGINIDLARRNLVDSIYKQSVLEGVATTYSDTETLVNGGKVKDMTSEDVSKVVNLKHAWEFILTDGVIQYPSNYAILCQINAVVQEGFSYTAGKIRNVPVIIGGCSYIPPVPLEDRVKEELGSIMAGLDVVEASVEALLYVMKRQIFLGGNKRTAVIFANHHLIQSGKGLIVIPAEAVPEFKKLLVHFYETDEKADIIAFLKEKCLTRL